MIFSKVNNMYELLGYDHMFGKHVAPFCESPEIYYCLMQFCVWSAIVYMGWSQMSLNYVFPWEGHIASDATKSMYSHK